jgi:two-component system LytT family sensor kinase
MKGLVDVTSIVPQGRTNAHLTTPSTTVLDSVRMRKAWTPPTRWVFGVATVLGLFSTLQAYRLTVVTAKPGMPIEVSKLLALNLAYWFVPALLLPSVVWVARRFPLDAGNLLRHIPVHIAGAMTFAMLRFAGMTGVKLLLWSGDIKPASVTWWVYAQRHFLSDLDWCLMVYSAIVGVSHALAYHRESQERKLKEAQLETRLIEARLKTLEAELHPHFLFNTLHAISTLVHRDPESADRMISRLSDLLRITFDRSGEATISLKEEIEFLQKYLDIEQTRFQDRLTVRVEVDPEVLDAEVPRMILQPLVENAMKHGIAHSIEKGHVHIEAGRENDRLWMEVRDNGGGLHGGTLKKLRTGVGLSNTRARLDVLYPGRHRLEFTELHGGLAVRVEIPFQRAAGATAGASFRAAS